jgi:hypothetical protein
MLSQRALRESHTHLNGDPLWVSAKQHAADAVGANRDLPLQRIDGSCNWFKSGSDQLKHDFKDHGLIKTEFLIFESFASQGFQKLSFGFY